MDKDNLINSLCDDLKPVKPLAHPLLRARPWLLMAIAYIVVATFIGGLRPDLFSMKLHDTTFLFEIIMAFAIMLSALFVSFWTSVPDMRGQRWLVAIPITLTLVFILWTVCRVIGEEPHLEEAFLHHCFGDGLIFTTLPIAGLLALSAGRTATCYFTCSTLNILCASAMGFIALRLTCMNDDIEHAILNHLAPYMVLALFVSIVAKRLYRW